jgi:hypothetical protein
MRKVKLGYVIIVIENLMQKRVLHITNDFIVAKNPQNVKGVGEKVIMLARNTCERILN